MALKRSLVPLLALILAAAPALADPTAGQAVAQRLLKGRVSVKQAQKSWEAAGVGPTDALALLREGRIASGTLGDVELELTDTHERKTRILVHVPKEPRADGRYGVLLMLHGLGGHAGHFYAFAKKIAPAGTIVIAPDAKKLPPELENVDIPKMGSLSLFPHWWRYHSEGFALAALAEVGRRYPLDHDRVVLSGYSMGGYGAWNLGLRFSGRFAAVTPFSAGIARSEALLGRHENSRALLANAENLPLFFVHGNRDQTVPVRYSRGISAELKALGIKHEFREVEGGPHILRSFLRGDKLTDDLTTWLAEQERTAWPRALSRTALQSDHGRDRWLQIDTLNAPVASLRATVKGQRIQLQAEGVARCTLFLDPQLVDVTAPIRVECDGVVLHEGLVAPSWKALSDSFRGDAKTAAAVALKLELPRVF
ncbi:MAG: alpha/beta fold hydrolase [Planctomycetes bacterium]|nr:alpha/beta fold hydrolase [Planctomycetota bacterium]